MKHTLQFIFTMLIMFGVQGASAQSNVFDFSITSDRVTFGGKDMDVSSRMARDGAQLVWTQSRGGITDTTDFIVTSTTGDWDKAMSLGRLTLHMVHNNTPVDFTLVGDRAGITLTLNVGHVPQGEVYTFPIDAVSYKQ